MMDNITALCGGRAHQQMWYAPNRRITTPKATRMAISIADDIKKQRPLGEDIDETALFAAMHTCVYRVSRCNTATGSECCEWVRRWRVIREYLVQENMGLVYSMMARLRLHAADHDDIRSDGMVALARAVERFNPWRGFRFSTYACNLIVRDLINSAKRATRYRRMFPYNHDVAFERPQPHQDRHETLYVERLQIALDRNLAGLTDLESRILKQRFPTDLPKPRTLQQIGDTLGVSKERVRQIQIKALSKLRDALDADPVLQ